LPIRRFAPTSFLLALSVARAADLAIVEPLFLQYENGPAREVGQEHRAGDQVWFQCRVTGYGRTDEPDPKFGLKWTWRVADQQGRLLTRDKDGKVSGELAAEDKEYRPRLRFDFQLPVLLLPGEYQIELTLVDEMAKAEKKARFPVTVEGRALELPKELAALQFRYFRQEDERRPMAEALYRAGDAVWLRFDIAGFRHGEKNKIDVSYGLLVLGPSGQPFLRDDPAAHHVTETFYPQFYVPASLKIQLPPKATPGDYVVLVTLRDHVSGATAASRSGFVVE
jgi:hypothetical protein